METETGVGEHGEGMGRRPATYADLEACPKRGGGALRGGTVRQSSARGTAHGGGVPLGGELDGSVRSGAGWPRRMASCSNRELHLGEDVLVPDWPVGAASGCRALRDRGLTLAPDWVCEVLSPSTRRELDRGVKLPRVRARGRAARLADRAGGRTLEVFRLEGARYPCSSRTRARPTCAPSPSRHSELELAFLFGARSRDAEPLRRSRRWMGPRAVEGSTTRAPWRRSNSPDGAAADGAHLRRRVGTSLGGSTLARDSQGSRVIGADLQSIARACPGHPSSPSPASTIRFASPIDHVSRCERRALVDTVGRHIVRGDAVQDLPPTPLRWPELPHRRSARRWGATGGRLHCHRDWKTTSLAYILGADGEVTLTGAALPSEISNSAGMNRAGLPGCRARRISLPGTSSETRCAHRRLPRDTGSV